MVSVLLALLLLGGAGAGAGVHYAQKSKQTGQTMTALAEKDIKNIPNEIKNAPQDLLARAKQARAVANQLLEDAKDPQKRAQALNTLEKKVMPYLEKLGGFIDEAQRKLDKKISNTKK